MANFKIANWAAMIGLAAAWILIAGGIMGLKYERSYVGIYSIILGGLLIPLLWPFKYLGPLKAIFQHYWVACVLCLLLSVFCFFETPTILGGGILAVAGIVFGIGAFRKEKGEYFER